MTKGKGVSRKAKRIVRSPATKFAQLQKRMRKRADRAAGRPKRT